MKNDIPIIIWSSIGLPGSTALKDALDDIGVSYKIVFGFPTDKGELVFFATKVKIVESPILKMTMMLDRPTVHLKFEKDVVSFLNLYFSQHICLCIGI